MTRLGEDSDFCYIDIAMEKIGESFARFRLIRPHSESSMLKSIRRFGQLTPVVVGSPDNDRYEIIDGFKRLRALRSLKKETVRARVLDWGMRALKATMIQLNREVHSIGYMEEALLVRSLHRDDGLDQVEIASLLGRDKSWVSRQVALVERLSEDVLEHLRLGLITAAHGRELVRLSRGNQKQTLECLLKHHLTSRETRRLVTMLLDSPRCCHDNLLWLPLEILDDRCPPRPSKVEKPAVPPFDAAILRLEQCCAHVIGGIDEGVFLEVPKQHISITELVEGTLDRLKKLARQGPF
ncbi:MAG: ParB/RepB/Spo0J family partition protein [Deltaproteobacteria bacterium]|nr:ParB/RepB/Spo0J family partition protein [Deltaproteobacteria bacterium]